MSPLTDATASVLVTNISDLVTLAPLAARYASHGLSNISDGELGRERGQAWLLIEAGQVRAFGRTPPPALPPGAHHVDAKGGLVMPGLVDAHTHPLFAGSRAHEMTMRLNGATYQEIAEKGGGIRSTVNATRSASDALLGSLLAERCANALRYGVTSLEVKSGYGLSVAEELRHLRILSEARQKVPQTLSVTCLALHAASPEYPDRASWVAGACKELLPQVASEKLADWVDAFIEDGYFTVAECAPYFERARELGLGCRLHADEFSDAGAAKAAADWGAASADHLQFASTSGLAAMAAAGVVAVVLPGTSLYTKIPFANARRMADLGLAVAVASDFNPGSCRIDNLPMLAALAAVQCGLRPAEAVAGVTLVAAHALRLANRKGALAPGYDGDFIVYEKLPDMEEWLADFGRTAPNAVFLAGRQYKTGT